MRKLKICFASLFAFLLCACGSDSKYVTSIQWADTGNYVFAVENDDFDGDIFEEGEYTFEPSATDLKDPKKTPIVWDIYVSNNYYTSINELKPEELKLTVGGTDNTSGSLKLKKNDYVYVKYNEVYGEPTGILNIDKK